MRLSKVEFLIGDNDIAIKKLGWQPQVKFDDWVKL